MADIVNKATRSHMMASVRSSSTSLERLVRRQLHRRGFRFRLNAKDLPGAPDIVLPRFRTVIFVHGCFWHHHHGCRLAALPATNRGFWRTKLLGNAARDRRNIARLRSRGWRVLTVWQCACTPAGRLELEVDRVSRHLRRVADVGDPGGRILTLSPATLS